MDPSRRLLDRLRSMGADVVRLPGDGLEVIGADLLTDADRAAIRTLRSGLLELLPAAPEETLTPPPTRPMPAELRAVLASSSPPADPPGERTQDLVASAVVALAVTANAWEATLAEARRELAAFAGRLPQSPDWPRSDEAMLAALQAVAGGLAHGGINVYVRDVAPDRPAVRILTDPDGVRVPPPAPRRSRRR